MTYQNQKSLCFKDQYQENEEALHRVRSTIQINIHIYMVNSQMGIGFDPGHLILFLYIYINKTTNFYYT